MDENMNMNEVVNSSNINNSNNGNKSKLIIIIAILVVALVVGGCLLAKRTNFTAKELYVGFLNSVKNGMHDNEDKLDSINFAKGVIEANIVNVSHSRNNSKEYLESDLEFYEWMYDYYKDEEDEYYQQFAAEYKEKIDDLKQQIANYSEDVSSDNREETNVKVSFDKTKNLFFIEKDDMQILADRNNDFVYTKDKNNKVVFSETPYSISRMLSSFDELNTSKQSYELYEHMIDILIKNLKDEYFVDGNKIGVSEYTIRMNKKQIIEFYSNIVNDICEDKVIMDYILENLDKGQDEADEVKRELKEAVEYVTKDIDSYDKLNFELRTFLKGGRIEDFVRMEISIQVNDSEIFFDIKGEDNKSIMDSKELHASGYLKEGDQKVSMECSLIFQDNEISFEYVMTQEYNGSKVSASMRYALETVDKKKFEDSSKIRFVMTVEQAGRKEEMSIVARSSENKRLLDSKEIILEAFTNDKKEDGEFSIKSNDNNTIENSKEIVVTVSYNGQSEKILTIKTNDGNGLGESHDLEFIALSRNEEIFKIVLKTNDNKSFEETRDFEFRIVVDDEEMFLKFKTVDGKNFDETSGFEIEGQFEDVKFSGKLVSKENKSLEDSKLFIIEFKLDENENHLDFIFDENKMEMDVITKSYYQDSEIHIKYYEDNSLDLENKLDMKNANEISISELCELLGISSYQNLLD